MSRKTVFVLSGVIAMLCLLARLVVFTTKLQHNNITTTLNTRFI